MARSGRAELTPEKAKTRLAAWLSQRFFVRFHLSLILGFCLAAGLVTTKVFLTLGMETMHWRWPLALLASYLAFLLGVRIWLAYVGIGRFLDRRGDSGSDVLDMVDGFGSSSSGGGSGSVGSGASSGGSGGFSGGGGRFGGGGASGNFSSAGDGESLSLASVGSGGSSSSSGLAKFFGGGGGGGSGGDLDEGIFVVLAIAALLAVVFGAGVYLIWQAPALLAEAAFEGALAGGLVKSIRRVDDPGWIGGAVRASALPFVVIFACTMAIAGLAEHYAPEARTLPEAIHLLLQ